MVRDIIVGTAENPRGSCEMRSDVGGEVGRWGGGNKGVVYIGLKGALPGAIFRPCLLRGSRGWVLTDTSGWVGWEVLGQLTPKHIQHLLPSCAQIRIAAIAKAFTKWLVMLARWRSRIWEKNKQNLHEMANARNGMWLDGMKGMQVPNAGTYMWVCGINDRKRTWRECGQHTEAATVGGSMMGWAVRAVFGARGSRQLPYETSLIWLFSLFSFYYCLKGFI